MRNDFEGLGGRGYISAFTGDGISKPAAEPAA
jgi:hypothetical protein